MCYVAIGGVRSGIGRAYPIAAGTQIRRRIWTRGHSKAGDGLRGRAVQARMVDRNDHLALTVAKLIIGLAQGGERDPDKLSDRAAKILRK
jgi:hypothetical protein